MMKLNVLKKLFIIIFGIFIIDSWILPLYSLDNNIYANKLIRIGVAAMISPKNTINVYREVLFYIEEMLGIEVIMVQRKNYKDMDKLLKECDVEIAFICSGPYVSNHKEFNAELLVAPVAYGKSVYYSYMIVHKDSRVTNINGLKGKSFAFTDRKSNTGYIVPVYILSRMKKTPDDFFGNYIFSGSHDNSIELVANKKINGASVDHLIWKYMDKVNPEITEKTKIISISEPYGMPPIVVHPGINSKLKKELREILLNMHLNKNGERILKKIFIDKFIIPKDSDYDSIREMQKWIKKSNINSK